MIEPSQIASKRTHSDAGSQRMTGKSDGVL
jgi:hypothetical protein